MRSSELSAARTSVGDRDAIATAADEIVARRLWCVVEACVDVPRQRWEPRLIVFRREGEAVADAVAEWTRAAPHQDVRLSGCRRSDLRPAPRGAHAPLPCGRLEPAGKLIGAGRCASETG